MQLKTILIFYDSDPADLKFAMEVAGVVRQSGFDPWLADNSVKRNWRTEVEDTAKSASCAGALVIWTEKSKENNIVCEEASLVSGLKLPLLGLFANGVQQAPLGLGAGPRFHFNASDKPTALVDLEKKVGTVFGDGGNARILKLGEKHLTAPGMVLSVSSFETQIEPEESLKLLKIAHPPAILVSAYDILRPPLQKRSSNRLVAKPKIHDTSDLHELRADGSVVFLDSGNYEAMRYKDKDWIRGKKRLLEAQEIVEADLVFTHDRLPNAKPFEKACAEERIDQVSKEFERDVKLVDCTVAPIIHAPRLPGNGYCYELLPNICCGVAKAVNPKLIAVAERELGDGLLKRVETIAKIRDALDRQKLPTCLHVLGTGNPITTAFLSLAGADFFDGLEWCRTAIDGRRWRLYHFQQWDLLASQSGMIESDVIGRVVSSDRPEIPWVTKAALHNLAFFLQADATIREHHLNGEMEKLFFERLELDVAFMNAKKVIDVIR